MGYTILIAESDKSIADSLKLNLRRDGYIAIVAENGTKALNVIENIEIDLVILNIMMPNMDGYELAIKIRKNYFFPIIFTSAKKIDVHIIPGFNSLNDDYMCKPYTYFELLGSVEFNIQRYIQIKGDDYYKQFVYVVGDIELNKSKMSVHLKGKRLHITQTEFKILLLLMKNPGKVFSIVEICKALNGQYFKSDDNTVMVHISRIRKKMNDDSENPKYIKNIRGEGYTIDKR